MSAPKKAPLFTKDVFSTKSFGPGHLLGAVIAVVGTYAAARAFVRHGQERSEAAKASSRSRGQYR